MTNRKLKKALKEIYASEKPEHMQDFLKQLRKNKKQKKLAFFIKFTSPVIAMLILGIITSYSYMIYQNHYQPYEISPEAAPTEKIILETESEQVTENMTESITKEIFQISTTETILKISPQITTTTITEITTQTSILSEIQKPDTPIITENATDITESLPEIINSEIPDIISNPETTTQTETTTIQNTISMPTRQEICNLFAQNATLEQLTEQYSLNINSNLTDANYPVIAQNADFPDILFLFNNSDNQYILNAVTAPVSSLLPELINQPVSEAENLLNFYCLENNNHFYLLENNTAIYDFYDLQKLEILCNQNITIINPALTNYQLISDIANLFQEKYFALYHPELENYILTMNDSDYEAIENLFAEIKYHVPQNHKFYQDWLTIQTGTVKQNHNPVNSYAIAETYFEYIGYTALIYEICTELEKKLPEDIYANIKLSNQNWGETQDNFLENIIPYHGDESYAEVVCFEAESAKCRALILLMYLQNIN